MTWSDSPWVFLYSIVLIFVLVSWAYVPGWHAFANKLRT